MAIKENMDLYRCEKCKKLYTSEYAANICCKQYHCRVCGKETPQYMLICDSCAEHERFEKARKMTLAEYYEEFPGNMLYYGEEFYDDIESLLDSIDCDYEDIPKYEEDSDVEDFYFDDAGAKELREFVKQWNAKYAKSYYSWNDKVVVMLPPEYQKERVND